MSLKRINKGKSVFDGWISCFCWPDWTAWLWPVVFCIHPSIHPSRNRTCRFGKGSPSQLFCRTSWRWYVPLAGHYHGTRWLPVRRRRFLLGHSLSRRLPLQATQGPLHHSYLSLQHQLEWRYLLGYLEGSMESRLDHQQSLAINLLPSHWSQPRWSVGSRHCATPQIGQGKTRQHRTRMDF